MIDTINEFTKQLQMTKFTKLLTWSKASFKPALLVQLYHDKDHQYISFNTVKETQHQPEIR